MEFLLAHIAGMNFHKRPIKVVAHFEVNSYSVASPL
jgi:hypothetical protein